MNGKGGYIKLLSFLRKVRTAPTEIRHFGSKYKSRENQTGKNSADKHSRRQCILFCVPSPRLNPIQIPRVGGCA